MSEKNIINDEQMSEIAGGYDRIVSARYAIRSINSADTESWQIRMANRQVRRLFVQKK